MSKREDAAPDLAVGRREMLMGSAAGVLAVASVAGAPARAAPAKGKSSLAGAAAAYVPTDAFFGKAVIDQDVMRQLPIPHRMIIGGFPETDLRFGFYFPDNATYRGRFFQHIHGGNGGTEPGSLVPDAPPPGYPTNPDHLAMAVSLGGYLVESNQGHHGLEECKKAKHDASVYGYRASAEAARFGKYLAEKIYGAKPHHGYCYGGSGGARRAVNCGENGGDVWAGAMPYMGGGPVVPIKDYNPTEPAHYSSHHFGAMFNVQRVLKDRLSLVVDATQPGGSGNPYEHLTADEADALSELYRLGYPRGQEYMIAYPAGQIGNWAWGAETLIREDPGYWTGFWTEPGYVGHDTPHLVKDDLVDAEVTVKAVLTAGDIAKRVAAGGPEAQSSIGVRAATLPPATILGIEVSQWPKGYMMGSSLKFLSGKIAGRQLWCTSTGGEVIFCDGIGEAGNLKFAGAGPGDRLKIDNRAFLAYCYFHRHHVYRGHTELWANFTLDGHPIYPQRSVQHHKETLWGPNFTATPQSRILFVQHTHDSSIWPGNAIRYHEEVKALHGPKADDMLQVRWVQYAEHGGPPRIPMKPSAFTRLVSYAGHIEQNMTDLVAWVEEGKKPALDNATYTRDGRFILPDTPEARGGVQPAIRARANGKERAEVKAGEPVTLSVAAGVPPSAGRVIRVEWDFEGSGTFPFVQPGVDGSKSKVELSTTYAFAKPGTYFPSVRVTSHREGDMNARIRRVDNLGRVRVVVT